MSQLGLLWGKRLLFDEQYFWVLAVAIIMGDFVLTQLIIHFVPYTEIDFETYMYHIELYDNGERDYSMMVGPSGPLVKVSYPAGHVLIHRLLAVWITGGSKLRIAQHIYGFVYVASVILTCAIYRQVRGMPNYLLLVLPLSKRLHSLFVLRLFNDCWSLVIVQAATLSYTIGWDDFASVLFSLALSVKMSILLYLPGLLLLLFKRHGLLHTIRHVAIMILSQALVALPFLRAHPWSYLSSAFEFSRVFLYRWTVNWRFLDEDVFLSRQWALSLLAAHLCTLVAFATIKWCNTDGGVISILNRGLRNPSIGASKKGVSADEFVTILFTSNLIGILFARSLHYQFYSWYAQQIPFLLWRTKYPVTLRVAIILCIEYAWNVFPSTNLSSSMLFASNFLLLIGIWFGFPQGKAAAKIEDKEKKSS